MKKQTIIIFEGEDCSGKSEIGQALALELGIPYFKYSGEHDGFKKGELRLITKYASTFFADFLRQTGCSIVLDRFHPSEFAYARAFDRSYDPEVIHDLDHKMAALNALIVICYKHDLSGYADDLIAVDSIREIRHQYQLFADMTQCHKLILDTTDQDLQRQLSIIMRFLDWKEGRVA